MKHRLDGLRGQAYVAESKRVFAEDGPAILARFNEIIEQDGKFTPKALGRLATEFRVPLSWLDDYLPEITGLRYPSGTWERLKSRGIKARDVGVTWD